MPRERTIDAHSMTSQISGLPFQEMPTHVLKLINNFQDRISKLSYDIGDQTAKCRMSNSSPLIKNFVYFSSSHHDGKLPQNDTNGRIAEIWRHN